MTGPGRGRGRGLGGGWGLGKVTNPGSAPSLSPPAVTKGPLAGLRGVGGGVGLPGGGPGLTGPGRGRGRGLGGGWGRGNVMKAGTPPMSTRIPTAPDLVGFPVVGFCAARMAFLALRFPAAWKVWVLGAPKTLVFIPIVTGVALRVRNKCEMILLGVILSCRCRELVIWLISVAPR